VSYLIKQSSGYLTGDYLTLTNSQGMNRRQ
jgi:hypothetical protein